MMAHGLFLECRAASANLRGARLQGFLRTLYPTASKEGIDKLSAVHEPEPEVRAQTGITGVSSVSHCRLFSATLVYFSPDVEEVAVVFTPALKTPADLALAHISILHTSCIL